MALRNKQNKWGLLSKGIKRNVIYTEEVVKNELVDILNTIESDEGIFLLGDVIEKKAYYTNKIAEWAEQYKNCKDIQASYKRIKSILENRLNRNGLRNKTNPIMTIFNLKNNYGWKDKHETDINITNDLIDTDRIKRIANRIVEAKEIEAPEFKILPDKTE